MGKKDDDSASVVSGSSVGSSASQAKDEKAEREGAEEEEEQEDLLNSKQSIIGSAFGILHQTLGPVKYDHLLRFAASRVVLDFVQLLLLVLRPDFGFQINTDLWVWHAIKWVEFANPLTSDGYNFYIPWIYVGVALLACGFGIAAWISWRIKKQHFPVVWPVMLLRLALNTAVFLFYISCFTVFLAAFNCNWFEGRQGQIVTASGEVKTVDLRFRMHRFPEVECLELPHVVHGAIAFVACAVFATVAFFVTITDYEPNPASRRYLATPHSSIEVWALAAKTIMALNMAIFSGQLYIQSVIMCLATLSLPYLYIRWQPHFNEWVNHFRSGLYTMLFWTSVFVAILKFDHRRDDPGHKKWLTDAMLIGLGPVLVFGWLMSFFRLRLLQWRALRAIRSSPPAHSQEELRNMYRFNNPREVEIVMRVLRQWKQDDDEVLEEDAVKLADLVAQVGLALFKDSPYLLTVYANFLIKVLDNHQLGSSQLQRVSKLEDNSLCDRYVVYVREQENKQRSMHQTNAGDSALDLVAYVEAQKNFRILARTHRAALVTLRNFWALLLHQDVPFSKVAAALTAIHNASMKADKTFKVLLDRYPQDVRLMEMYARFLEHVKCDPWTASKFASAADKLEEDQGGNNAGALMAQSDSASMLEQVNEKTSAVIVINAEGMMKVVNRLALKLLGYKKSEVEGKNVSMLMPNPFSSRHNGYLRTHISTGKKHILDSVREVVALHKDQYVFPVQLAVTKVSGVGADSMFMGVLRRYQVEPGVIRVWVMPSGSVICIDERFMDAFGKGAKDVAGRPFPSLVTDADAIMRLLDRAAAASEADFKLGKVAAKGISVLHGFMDPVEVDITVDCGGSDSQRMLAFNLKPTAAAGKVLVTDARGSILYMNNDMREMLGYPPQAQSKMDISMLLPPPYNMLHGHWMKAPSAKKPKQSCRSSATVVMVDSSGQTIPVKPHITTREVEDTVQHVVQIMPSSWDHGLDERRLVLTLDTHGTIMTTSNAPSSLFGFRPSELVGKSVGDIVDVLSELSAELPGILSKMAQKVIQKAGYSWRVGVFPPDGHASTKTLSQMDRMVRERSTRPALMQFQLIENEDLSQLPEIKMLLYKADMVSAIIDCDAHGVITRPIVSPLDPSHLLFGVGERTMNRKPLSKYLDMPTRQPTCLLQDDKAMKGAMKSGTSGRKVGPLKTMNGFHADGSCLQLKVLAVATSNGHIVTKITIDVQETGDVPLFLQSLNAAEAKNRRISMASVGGDALGFASPTGSVHDDGAEPKGASAVASRVSFGSQAKGAEPQKAGPAPPKPRHSGGGAQPKAVKFAIEDEQEDEDNITPSEGGGSSEDGDSREDEDQEEEDANKLDQLTGATEGSEAEGTDSEAGSATAEEKPEEFVTDWARGRRLKKLHVLLHTRMARLDFFHFKEQTIYLLCVILGIHVALFAAYLVITNNLEEHITELDANGQLVVGATSITVEARKIHNLYHGKTNPALYEMSDDELEVTVGLMKEAIERQEQLQTGVYLGFHGLRRLQDVFDLLELWEGSNLDEEQFVDVRMPSVVEEPSNLWILGNTFISAAREVALNHKSIAERTGNDFNLDRSWRYLIDNGPDTLAKGYTRSLNNMLQRDFHDIQEIEKQGVAFLIVELVVTAGCMVWLWILLKGVQGARHRLVAVFLTIPSGFLRAIAQRQLQIAEEVDEGMGGTQEEEEEEGGATALLKGTAQNASEGTAGDKGMSKEAEKRASKDGQHQRNFVVDVDALVQGQQQLAGKNVHGENVLPWWKRLWVRLREPPIIVGKRKLLPYHRQSYILMLPLAVWFVLLLVIYLVSIERQLHLKQPLTDNYLSNRLSGFTNRVIAEAHRAASVDSVEDVAETKDALASALSSLQHMYTALLYGTEEQRDMTFIELEGTLFDNRETQRQFFERTSCTVKFRPEKYCFPDEEDRFHEVTSHGLDAMLQRLSDEVDIMLQQTDEATFNDGLASGMMDYIWNVGWHALTGRQKDMNQFYTAQAALEFEDARNPKIVLFALSWVFAAAYIYFLFNPFLAILTYELRQVCELLSQLPSDMNVDSACARALNIPDPNEQMGASGTGPRAPGAIEGTTAVAVRPSMEKTRV